MDAKSHLPDDEQDEVEEIAQELEVASDETPTDVTGPELTQQTKDLTEWDEAPSAHGVAAPKTPLDDDDDTIAAKLVYGGTDEADRDQRIAAADPDFEP